MTWQALFDQSNPEQKRRYEQVKSAWQHLKLKEVTVENQTQLTMRGYQFELDLRSEEHTSELQSLMRISYAVFCLKKKKKTYNSTKTRIDATNQHKNDND